MLRSVDLGDPNPGPPGCQLTPWEHAFIVYAAPRLLCPSVSLSAHRSVRYSVWSPITPLFEAEGVELQDFGADRSTDSGRSVRNLVATVEGTHKGIRSRAPLRSPRIFLD
jgi:hypothetical protein